MKSRQVFAAYLDACAPWQRSLQLRWFWKEVAAANSASSESDDEDSDDDGVAPDTWNVCKYGGSLGRLISISDIDGLWIKRTSLLTFADQAAAM